jgi:membrane peptidoglycan carboxypeptidase
MKKIIKRCILLIFSLAVLTGLIYAAPRVYAVQNLRREAREFVYKSSDATFMESKTTIVYDTNGDELCEIKNSKDMYYVSISEIPSTLADAFIVMEDQDFYSHSGVDYKAIIRATLVNSARGEIVQGASTITQQLARNIFLTQEVTWERKIEEMYIAGYLEKKYTKEKILEFYLNNIYFGNGYYGVEAAANGYFSKSVSELTLSEQAFIAAIPNGPTRYNPLTNFDNTVSRRNVILRKLYDEEYISSMDYYVAYMEEIELNPAEESAQAADSVVTYVRHCATEALMEAAGFTFRYNFDSEEDYEAYAESYDDSYSKYQQSLVSGGYTVYTSIDPEIQEKLQAAVDDGMSSYTELSDDGIYKMQCAATCIDNETGNVVAIVGSRSQEGSTALSLNRAYQSYRQSGSAIKPLSVYTPYFMLGHTPDEMAEDVWSATGPNNADGSYAGEISLRDAVKYSKNTVAWNIYQEITPRVGISYLMKMGFKKVWYDKDYNAAALGGFTYGVTTEEMAGAYATLANDGVYRQPTCVITIYGAKNQLVRDESERGTRVYDTNSARTMTNTLLAVMEPGGTGYSAAVDGWQIAGKSGSTNSDKDIWFCGYSPYYTTAIWMGYDYPEQIDGVNATQPIFKQFMTEIHQNIVVKTFAEARAVKNSLEELTTESETQQETTAADTTQNNNEETGADNAENSGNAGNGTNGGDNTNATAATTDGIGNNRATAGTTQPATKTTQPATQSTTRATQSATAATAPTMAHPGADTDANISGSGDKDVNVRGDADAW